MPEQDKCANCGSTKSNNWHAMRDAGDGSLVCQRCHELDSAATEVDIRAFRAESEAWGNREAVTTCDAWLEHGDPEARARCVELITESRREILASLDEDDRRCAEEGHPR